MSWFKKKQETPKLSKLPELPTLPDLPENNSNENLLPPINPYPEMPQEEIHSLPSFPNSEIANKMSREAIKSALEVEPKLRPYTQEIDYSKKFAVEDSESENVEQLYSRTPNKQESSEPIFVRIDKFQLAVKNINEIRKQITEIESYLSEIKKIKAKEEEELQEWEREISEAKNKLDDTDKILFSKL
ncbi:MAG: hypothetical protein ABH840_04300 [Nanoarchaeota archaeon]